jgi:UDP-sugar transporter A1/2/3
LHTLIRALTHTHARTLARSLARARTHTQVLKHSKTCVWTRNVQMGSIGALLALLTCFVCDGRAVAQQGFFQGWNWFVFSVAAQVGIGGLLTALVVKYADNILKGPSPSPY